MAKGEAEEACVGLAVAVQCIGNEGGVGDSRSIGNGMGSGDGSDVGRRGDVICGGGSDSNNGSNGSLSWVCRMSASPILT